MFRRVRRAPAARPDIKALGNEFACVDKALETLPATDAGIFVPPRGLARTHIDAALPIVTDGVRLGTLIVS